MDVWFGSGVLKELPPQRAELWCQLPDNETKEVKGKVRQEEYPKKLTG